MANNVIVRCKPADKGCSAVWRVIGGNKLRQETGYGFETAAAGAVCTEGQTHADLYSSHISEVFASVTEGYDVTILAYGLPNSGKTYSMMGSPGQAKFNKEAKGIIVRCMDQLVQGKDKTLRVTCSYCLISSDGRVNDLIDVRKRNLVVEEVSEPPMVTAATGNESNSRYRINGCTQQNIKSSDDVAGLLGKANTMRNATGVVHSRDNVKTVNAARGVNVLTRYKPHNSHAVFQYNIEHISDTTSIANDQQQATVSTVTLIDMAGHCIEHYCDESTSIDDGVNALHQVLDLISNGNVEIASSIARNTPLTRLLYSSLFGDAKCLVLSTLSMDDASTNVKRALQLSFSFNNVPNNPVPVCVPSSTISIGKIIEELNTLKSSLIEKCTGSNNPAGSELVPVDDSSVRIDGNHYEDLDEETTAILKKYIDLQDSLIGHGHSGMENVIKTPSKYKQSTGSTSVMVAPLKPTSSRVNVPITAKISTSTSLTNKPAALTSINIPPSPHVSPGTTGGSLPLLGQRPLRLPTPSPTLPPLQSGPHGTASVNPSQMNPVKQLSPLQPKPNILAVASKTEGKSTDDEMTSSDSDHNDEKQNDSAKPHTLTGTKTSLPALSAIPHVKPPQPISPPPVAAVAATLIPVSTGSQTSTPHTSLTQLKQSSEHHINTTPTIINRESATHANDNSMSSSQSSITSPSSAKSQRKKKKTRKKRSKSSLTKKNLIPNLLKKQSKENISSSVPQSAAEEDDTFDSNFKPGKLPINTSTNHHSFIPAQQQQQQEIPWMLREPLPQFNRQQIDVPVGADNRTLPKSERPNHDSLEEPLKSEMNHELHFSAMYGVKASYLKQLVMQHGVNIMDEYKRTPLMFAVKGNQPKMCEVLLGCKADVNAADMSGNTPLLWATIDANVKIMKILLKAGADVTQSSSENGCSVFHWAMRTPNIVCLKTLCSYPTYGMENKTDNEGLTPLHYAVTTEQPGHIKLFLSLLRTVEVNATDPTGRTPMNYAILNYSPSCIQALIEGRGADPVQYKDSQGCTPLHYACAEGSADCIRTLTLCKGCNINTKDNKKRTPLHWAAASGQSGIIQLLLRRNAERGHEDLNNNTALDYAEEMNHHECVKVLKNFGLRRPSTTWSITSQFSISPSTPPELDRTGHISMKQPHSNGRQDLFSGNDNTDRSPGDGGNSEPAASEGQSTGLMANDEKDESQEDTTTTNAQEDSISHSSQVNDTAKHKPKNEEATVIDSTGAQESTDGGDQFTPAGEEPKTDEQQINSDHERENVTPAAETIATTGDENTLLETAKTTNTGRSEIQSNNRRSLMELLRSCFPRRNNQIRPLDQAVNDEEDSS